VGALGGEQAGVVALRLDPPDRRPRDELRVAGQLDGDDLVVGRLRAGLRGLGGETVGDGLKPARTFAISMPVRPGILRSENTASTIGRPELRRALSSGSSPPSWRRASVASKAGMTRRT